MGPGWGGVAGEAWGGAGRDREPNLKNLLEFGPFQGASWLSVEGSTWSSKPVRSGSPRLGRFDSCAAPLGPIPRRCGRLRWSSRVNACRSIGGDVAAPAASVRAGTVTSRSRRPRSGRCTLAHPELTVSIRNEASNRRACRSRVPASTEPDVTGTPSEGTGHDNVGRLYEDR